MMAAFAHAARPCVARAPSTGMCRRRRPQPLQPEGRRRRLRCVCLSADETQEYDDISGRGEKAPATAEGGGGCGLVHKVPKGPVAVGDAFTLLYQPPDGYFKSETVVYTGGYNGWCGDDVPVMTPAERQPDGRYRVVVSVPDFARSIDFCFSDGVRFDTNAGGYYHVPVRFQQRFNEDGEVETFDSESTSQPSVEVGEFRDEEGSNTTAISAESERRFNESRAKLGVIAKEFDIGAIHVTQATAAFDRSDSDGDGFITLSTASDALTELGFDVQPSRIVSILRDFASLSESDPQSFERVNVIDFMVAYAKLESDDEGIDIV